MLGVVVLERVCSMGQQLLIVTVRLYKPAGSHLFLEVPGSFHPSHCVSGLRYLYHTSLHSITSSQQSIIITFQESSIQPLIPLMWLIPITYKTSGRLQVQDVGAVYCMAGGGSLLSVLSPNVSSLNAVSTFTTVYQRSKDFYFILWVSDLLFKTSQDIQYTELSYYL